jgi:predicted glutamine amidotransferase
MCRLLGIVADEPAQFTFCLREAPRSLGHLSREHPDGWGVAVYDEARSWNIRKQPLSAFADPGFADAAGGSRGDMMIAHVRRRTVGPVSMENTHPFKRGRWVFAHNGTITEVDRLRAAASEERLAEVSGTTDSEIFFAFLLTRLDSIGKGGPMVAGEGGEADVDRILTEAVAEMARRPEFGASNFLLADGATLYAFRQGRTLHLLERTAGDAPHSEIPSRSTGTVMETSWAPRQHAILVASEEITPEPWVSVAEGTLLKVNRHPKPAVTILAVL